MNMNTKCFYCVVLEELQEKINYSKEAATSYKGTPVCAAHALEVAESEVPVWIKIIKSAQGTSR